MKKNKIEVLEGTASFIDAYTIDINNGKESKKVTAKNIIIATGSKPTKLPFIDFDGDRIISSTEALKLKEVTTCSCGREVIGLELGQVYRRLGSDVTVIEFQDRIIPNMDEVFQRVSKSF